MPAADLTKRVLAEGVKDLMQTTPLNKLSVGDICSRCGINRNTFYYHFKDKYDLVNWIFYTEIMPHISRFLDADHWPDGLIALCLHMQENRKFYINALNTPGQNSFAECLTEFYRTFLIDYLEPLRQQMRLSESDLNIITMFYTHALVDLIVDWARDGMEVDPVPAVRVIESIINGDLYRQIEKLEHRDS